MENSDYNNPNLEARKERINEIATRYSGNIRKAQDKKESFSDYIYRTWGQTGEDERFTQQVSRRTYMGLNGG